MAQAVTSLSRAFEYFQSSGDVERAVATAEEYPVFPVARVPEVTALVEKAMELLPPDSPAIGLLLTRYAVNLSCWLSAQMVQISSGENRLIRRAL